VSRRSGPFCSSYCSDLHKGWAQNIRRRQQHISTEGFNLNTALRSLAAQGSGAFDAEAMGKITENIMLDTAAAKRKRRGAPLAVNSKVERAIFARNLRRFRIEANLSQRELAETTKIAESYISQLENAMHNLSVETMAVLARAPRTPLHEMFVP
jgi:DNA-binding XRE family transcriptional regulator